MSRARYNAVQKIVFAQLEPFCNRIVDEVSRALRKAGADIQVVFVHGGGSIPMKGHSQLRVKLEDKLRSYNGGYTVPALWIPAPFAQTLNRDGLVYLVDHAA